ncbi:hypothetical protein ABIB06_003733 [Bradyrhizobium sp. LB8.2]|uniref:hypothetical protein n=1 Tax=unclassified Bradyrhizobium TaxID=2631580 RepID=UPI003399B998
MFISGLFFATAALSLPSAGELQEVASAAGAAAAGFHLCGDQSKAKKIKAKFQDVADTCTTTKPATRAALNAFDLGYVNTMNSFSQQGGSCKGNNQARFETLMDVLGRAEDDCL